MDDSMCSGNGDVTLGSIFFSRRAGCAQRRAEGLVQLLMFLFLEQQRATGVWRLEILMFVSLFRCCFPLAFNELYLELELNQGHVSGSLSIHHSPLPYN